MRGGRSRAAACASCPVVCAQGLAWAGTARGCGGVAEEEVLGRALSARKGSTAPSPWCLGALTSASAASFPALPATPLPRLGLQARRGEAAASPEPTARPLARAFLLGEIFLGCLFPTRRSIVVGCEEGPAVCSGGLPPVTGQTLCDVRNPLCHFQCTLCRPHLHSLTLL